MTFVQMIGQGLNAAGSRRTASALAAGDQAMLADLARWQAEAGAAVLDVCAAGSAHEPEALSRLVDAAQMGTDVRLSLDSLDLNALRFVLPLCRRAPVLNSYSGALPCPDATRTLIRECVFFSVVVLCLDDRGSAMPSFYRLEVARRLADELISCGVSLEQLIFDPITLPGSAGADARATGLETMTQLRNMFGSSQVLCAVSNYGVGLPDRRSQERAYAQEAKKAGADVFLCDVCDDRLIGALRG